MLDLGNGAFGALQRYTDVYDIDAVVLSHLHADHCLDLTSYYVVRKYHPDGPAPARSRCSVRPAPPTGWRAPTTCRPRRACTASSSSATTSR